MVLMLADIDWTSENLACFDQHLFRYLHGNGTYGIY